MNAAWHVLLAIVATGAGATGAQQTPPVTLSVPAAEPVRVHELLHAWYGDEVTIEATPALTFTRPVPAEPRLWLLWDEWTLSRAAAAGAQLLALPFADELAIVAVPGAFEDQAAPTWEAIAMAPSLHDRLGLVAPEVDGGPWLAAMRQRLVRGEGIDQGIALWTTLDARAGRLHGSYASLLEDLGAGRLTAGIGPRRSFAAALQRAAGALRADRLPGTCARGFAIAPMAGPRARRIADDLLLPDRMRELAAAAGLTVDARQTASLAPETARVWWQRFETHVRGRGRGAEQLADALDVVFGIGFLVVAWFVYRALRRAPAAP